jgi:hypothetical protein
MFEVLSLMLKTVYNDSKNGGNLVEVFRDRNNKVDGYPEGVKFE